jgi:hypothetical protein
VDREFWVRSVIDLSVTRGKIESVKVNSVRYEALPTLWKYVEFSLAKVKLNISEEAEIKVGDGVDADAFASTPYVNTLVTSDAQFIELCELVEPDALEVISHKELLASIGL